MSKFQSSCSRRKIITKASLFKRKKNTIVTPLTHFFPPRSFADREINDFGKNHEIEASEITGTFDSGSNEEKEVIEKTYIFAARLLIVEKYFI